MGNIKPVYGNEAREGIFKGITMLNDAVKVTLGPMGRNVLMRKMHHGIHPTKDGVTVAEEINFSEELHNMGAELVKQASGATNDDAGDGTTTSTLLAWSMINEGLKKLSAENLNAVQVKRGMDAAVRDVIKEIKKVSVPVGEDIKKIRDVAIISANNDQEMGTIIADAFSRIGIKGAIKVQESHSNETYIDIVGGTQFDSGYSSPYFVTDTDTMQVIYDKGCDVVITEEKLTSSDQVRSIESHVRETGKPLIIIANDFTEDFLGYLVVRKIQSKSRIFLVKSPYFGLKREAYLDDLSVLVGATVLNGDLSISDADARHIGSVDKCIVTNTTTLMVNGHGKEKDVTSWIAQLEAIKADSPKEENDLKERISRLKGGIAVLHVGAASEAEVKEKRDRVNDAIAATKAAVEEGIVEGGGICLLRIYRNSDYIENTLIKDDSYFAGYQIVMESLRSPFMQILLNAGYKKDEIQEMENSIYSGALAGFNVANAEECDMIKAGIIDPAKVTRVALENAVSVAGVVITTECVLVDTSLQEREERLPAFLQG